MSCREHLGKEAFQSRHRLDAHHGGSGVAIGFWRINDQAMLATR
jgi:hypothetical protein